VPRGFGVSASVFVESGSGKAGASGFGKSASVFVESGRGAAGCTASGSSYLTFTKTGRGVAGCTASGSSYLMFTKAGRGVAGTVGAGPSQSLFVEAGRGVAGLVGAGPSQSMFAKAGRGVASLVGAGKSASVYAKAGRGSAGMTAAGWSQSLFVKAGRGVAGSAGFGASQAVDGGGAAEYVKAGHGVVGLVGVGHSITGKTGHGVAGGGPPVLSALRDDFNRADGALGANWGHPSVGGNMPLISSNQALVTNAGETGAVWTATSYGSDQELTVTLNGTAVGGEQVYLLLNVTDLAPTAFTGYLLNFDIVSSSTTHITLYKAVSGSFSIVQSGTGYTWASGDQWRLSKVGTAITLERNGSAVTLFNPATDGSPITGSSYAGFGGRVNTSVFVDDFTTVGSEPHVGHRECIFQDTGTGKVGASGSGSSVHIEPPAYRKAGYGKVGLTGSGQLRGSFHYEKSGHGTAGCTQRGHTGDGLRYEATGAGIAGHPGLHGIKKGRASAGTVGAGAAAMLLIEPPQDAILLICANPVQDALPTSYEKSGYGVCGLTAIGRARLPLGPVTVQGGTDWAALIATW
jgi:hypothetical protein